MKRIVLLALACPLLAEVAPDTPVSQLLDLASAALSSGSSSEALEYYNLAITREPENYLTIFKRGATYLSLGRSSQAANDFDRVLAIKPGFEGALTQRGWINARKGDWTRAAADWQVAGKQKELEQLAVAQNGALAAVDAKAKQDWEGCVAGAGAGIIVASQNAELRRLRADCRLEKGEVVEAVSDLQAVQKLSPAGAEDTAVHVATLAFYGLGEADKALEPMKACMHSDPESRKCGRLFKRLKRFDKEWKKLQSLRERRNYVGAVKILNEEIPAVKEESRKAREDGLLHPKAKEELVVKLVDAACDAALEMNSKKTAYCDELLVISPNALPAFLFQAQRQLDADDFEGAVHTLNTAREHHSSNRINLLLQKAQTLLKRSKTKDYYKILGVGRDASEREIKKAYLKASKQYHPDKVGAGADAATRKAAEAKMAAINEAYEVLYDSELRARFDAGEDPNDPHAGQQPFHGSPFGGGGQQFQFSGSFGGFPGFNMPRGGGGGGGGFPFGF